MIFGTVGTETLRKTLFWKLKSLSIRDLRAGGAAAVSPCGSTTYDVVP